MKKTSVFILGLLLSAIAIAQTPNKMSFQTVVRNSQGKLVVNQTIGVRSSILKGSATGTTVYTETHQKMSNVNGLLSLEIGGGTSIQGAFNGINWSEGPYFLKTELDLAGGTNYTISGVTEFVSVPYAKMAERSLKSDSSNYSDTSNHVRILKKGENVGDMNYWDGSKWVALNAGSQNQALLFCDGKPTWVVGGVCPGTISVLNCSLATNNGTLTATTEAISVTSEISYTGGNGGPHNNLIINSTGVTGLTATLAAGTFANGNGSLTFTITGTPTSSGTASFALNIGGKTCTLTQSVAAAPTSGYGANITDVEGNSYKTVYIGTQQWMGENLKTSKYSDGTAIPNITDNTQWYNNTSGAWSYLNNNATTNAKYGKLYNWYAVSKTTNGNKNICPTGWHVPTNGEWSVLFNYLGGITVAGGKMKEVGTTNWLTPNTGATNESLFTSLPFGFRYNDGVFTSGPYSAYYWSSSFNNSSPTSFKLNYTQINVEIYDYYIIKYGMSVRCLRD